MTTPIIYGLLNNKTATIVALGIDKPMLEAIATKNSDLQLFEGAMQVDLAKPFDALIRDAGEHNIAVLVRRKGATVAHRVELQAMPVKGDYVGDHKVLRVLHRAGQMSMVVVK